MLYLLQLVQALKYENFEKISSDYAAESEHVMQGLSVARTYRRHASIQSDTSGQSDGAHVDRWDSFHVFI